MLSQIPDQAYASNQDNFSKYYARKKIEVKSHHGVKRAFVYIQSDTAIPTDQKALNEWTNNSDYKVEQLHNILDAMIED